MHGSLVHKYMSLNAEVLHQTNPIWQQSSLYSQSHGVQGVYVQLINCFYPLINGSIQASSHLIPEQDQVYPSKSCHVAHPCICLDSIKLIWSTQPCNLATWCTKVSPWQVKTHLTDGIPQQCRMPCNTFICLVHRQRFWLTTSAYIPERRWNQAPCWLCNCQYFFKPCINSWQSAIDPAAVKLECYWCKHEDSSLPKTVVQGFRYIYQGFLSCSMICFRDEA